MAHGNGVEIKAINSAVTRTLLELILNKKKKKRAHTLTVGRRVFLYEFKTLKH